MWPREVRVQVERTEREGIANSFELLELVVKFVQVALIAEEHPVTGCDITHVQLVVGQDELARKFDELEKHVGKHDEKIDAILEAIRQLMAPPAKPKREIGFHVREQAPRYRTRKARSPRAPLPL